MYLKVSIYQVFVDKVLDLLGGTGSRGAPRVQVEHYIDRDSEEVVSKLKNITEKIVFSLEDFYAVMQEAFKTRRMESAAMQDNDLRKKSHLIVGLTLMRKTPARRMQEISHFTFAELAGSEQAVADERFFKDSSIKQFVTKSFNCLSSQLLRSALKKRASSSAIEEGDSKLVSCLRNTLTS